MSPADLRTLILSLPADHPARVAFVAGNSSECARLLSAPTQPGYVPTVELARWVYSIGLYGRASVVVAQPVPQTEQGQELYGLCRTLLGMLRDLPDVNVRAPEFVAGMQAFVGLSWVTTEQAAAIDALADNRKPIAAVSYQDVDAAFALGGA